MINKEAVITRTRNAINEFINEQILDALEVIEDKPVPEVMIPHHGQIRQYADGTREFVWKGKTFIIFHMKPNPTTGQIDIQAEHTYTDKGISLDEYLREEP